MKHAFEKQITVGLLATMLVASPVFAETTTTVSEPIGLKKRPVSTTSKKEDVPPAQGSGAAGTAARPNRLNLPPRESPVPGQGIGVRGEAESELAPYLNKTVTKISVEGNAEVPSEDILRAVYSKPGLPLTEEDISKDMQAIYGMGWFYEIQPSFQTVPEGVQITYHVQENPKFDHLEVTGNTKVSTEKNPPNCEPSERKDRQHPGLQPEAEFCGRTI